MADPGRFARGADRLGPAGRAAKFLQPAAIACAVRAPPAGTRRAVGKKHKKEEGNDQPCNREHGVLLAGGSWPG